jgi:serine/threonine-protein kinase
VVITVTEGPHQGRSFTFEGHDTFLVGRSPQAHFRLARQDEYFSRLHFLVEVNPPECRLLDLGSTNGTFVNGQKVAVTPLRHGDVIRGGQTVMRVSIDADASEVVTPRLPVPVGPLPPSVPVGPQSAPPLGATVSYAPKLPSARPDRPESVCVACGAPALPGSDTAANCPLTLCRACEEQSRQQEQPFPDYRLLRELGQGGMGIVYLAVHLISGDVVALKAIRPAVEPRPEDVVRFLREAQILQQLQHPHIVTFRASGESAGRLFFVMDYLAGCDARALLKQEGPLAVPRAVHIVCHLLEALDHAHQRGFVHRDVKPANLVILSNDGQEVVKLLDFGLARAYQLSRLSGLTLTGHFGGTLPFTAPEQITSFRESRPPVDQYAAAATLYNLLTDHYTHDFPRDFARRLLMAMEDDPVPIRSRRADVPEGLAAVLHRALERDPEQRFPDVAAFRAALLPFA